VTGFFWRPTLIHLIVRLIFLLLQATAVVNSGLLLMAVMGLLFPAVLHSTHSEAQQGASELALSRFTSCIMLVAYASYLYFQLSGRSSTYSPIGSVIPVPYFFLFLACDKDLKYAILSAMCMSMPVYVNLV
jgi:hypothetical protein